MLQFLEGKNATKAIAWLDKGETKDILNRHEIIDNSLFMKAYQSVAENKYLYLGVFIIIRNVFGSNRFKLIPTEWWLDKSIRILQPLTQPLVNLWTRYFSQAMQVFKTLTNH